MITQSLYVKGDLFCSAIWYDIKKDGWTVKVTRPLTKDGSIDTEENQIFIPASHRIFNELFSKYDSREQMVNNLAGLFGKPEDIKKHKCDLDPRLFDEPTKQD